MGSSMPTGNAIGNGIKQFFPTKLNREDIGFQGQPNTGPPLPGPDGKVVIGGGMPPPDTGGGMPGPVGMGGGMGSGMGGFGQQGLRGLTPNQQSGPAPMGMGMGMGGGMKKGGAIKTKSGSVSKASSASSRADGCATKGKTKGRFV